jgi:hypothetical protein
MAYDELVDILTPPTFAKSGVTKTLGQAWADEDWIGTFNLWIVQSQPAPSIIYQIRSPKSNWAPSKLDVTDGGHYQAGEEIRDGLREISEELGINYDFQKLISLGRKMHVSPDTQSHMRHNLVDIFLIQDDRPLSTYKLQESEVYAVCSCPISQLIMVHTQPGYKFKVTIVKSDKTTEQVEVNKESFPFNWDNYHFKIALLGDRYFKGDPNLIY